MFGGQLAFFSGCQTGFTSQRQRRAPGKVCPAPGPNSESNPKTSYLPVIPLIESNFELKNRKKLEPTSIALPAASASSIAFDDVMPLLPSAAGQSLW
jgi:hypothetical protein